MKFVGNHWQMPISQRQEPLGKVGNGAQSSNSHLSLTNG
nr:MAG TPA: Protein of unknown function (DUF434) [Caudoviricetes sp.]